MLVTMLDYNDFVGRIGIGRISNGKIAKGQSVVLIRPEGNVLFRVTQLQGFVGLPAAISKSPRRGHRRDRRLRGVTVGLTFADLPIPRRFLH